MDKLDYIEFEAAGHIFPLVRVSPRVHWCGKIRDGVSIENYAVNNPRGSWVIEFKDLERWYLAAKAYRKQLGKLGDTK